MNFYMCDVTSIDSIVVGINEQNLRGNRQEDGESVGSQAVMVRNPAGSDRALKNVQYVSCLYCSSSKVTIVYPIVTPKVILL